MPRTTGFQLPKQTTTWIVVADESGARIFGGNKPPKDITLLNEMGNAEARFRDRDIGTDKPGRTFSRKGQTRHAYSAHEAPHERVVTNFARELSRSLERAREKGEFDRLVLIAGPAMLGLLRATLNDPTSALIVDTLDKNFANVPNPQVLEYLLSQDTGRYQG